MAIIIIYISVDRGLYSVDRYERGIHRVCAVVLLPHRAQGLPRRRAFIHTGTERIFKVQTICILYVQEVLPQFK